ncbi:MAG: glycyl-tRNA synthetase [Parcubacteria group bacterium Gr01-1014_33]|nr:MAG: glycyl-tRNA synthetase [Parcubacteria group bacterium Gr01-1014_33]
MEDIMEKIISLAKRRGFIFPGSEIYGGLAGMWDYGPLGVELKNNIKREFWKTMVYGRDDTVGLDAAILMNPKVWEASGHTDAFTDPLVECKKCHTRVRADHEDEIKAHEEIHKKKKEKVEWTEPRKFNLLVEAKLGAVEEGKLSVYLRGEITQGVHVNFKNILDSSWRKLPFGIAQIGKAFRNEITPGNFTFRSREFEQMELQWFCSPLASRTVRTHGDSNADLRGKWMPDDWFGYWKEERIKWYISLGMEKSHVRFRKHEEDEKAHYAKAAWDIEYDSPFGGWKELEGIHNRGDWDLSRHSKFSGERLAYFDDETREWVTPWVIETSGGVDRAALFFLIDAYREEGEGKEKRTVLKLHPKLAPIKVAVFPLLANKPQLVEKAREVYKNLQTTSYNLQPIVFDDIGNIGKRYRRQDEIGTPWCVTIDHQTLEDDTVTVRDRDTMEQERVRNEELNSFLQKSFV